MSSRSRRQKWHDSCSTCIPSFPKHHAIDVSPMKGFSLGQALELQQHILRYIFEHLEYADLHMARQVCPVWAEAAEQELRRRTSASWFGCNHHPSLCRLHSDPQFHYSNHTIGLVAYNLRLISLPKYICLHDSPSVSRMPFAEYISKEIVQTNISYCTIGYKTSATEKDDLLLYHGLFLPAIPKIRMEMFYYNAKDYKLDPKEQIKCMLVFTQKYKRYNCDKFFMAALQGRNYKSVAMGGGLVFSTKMFGHTTQRYHRADDIFCIMFLKQAGDDADFDAYSTIIAAKPFETDSEQQSRDFEAALVKFKEGLVMRKCGAIFRFCCFAKHFQHEETVIIKRHFPNYPVLDLQVNCEIGWDTGGNDLLRESSEDEAPKNKKCRTGLPQLHHSWSTVLVLLMWGRKT